MHLTEEILARLRERYGEPARLEWEGEVSEREHAMATYNPKRMHDVTLFILNGERLALIRKPHFEPGIWRPPGGGIKEGEDFEAGVQREALEETGPATSSSSATSSPPRRASSTSRTTSRGERTSSSRARPATTLDPQDREEIAAARWGTLAELAGPLRERLLATGRAFWRYRVALHDAALEKIEQLG